MRRGLKLLPNGQLTPAGIRASMLQMPQGWNFLVVGIKVLSKNPTVRAREVVQQVKCLPCKHEDVNSTPRAKSK